MPHYRNGRPAKAGDLVRGRGYNVPYEIQGIVIKVNEESESCNLQVAHLEANSAITQTDRGYVAGVNIEYGEAGDFLNVEDCDREPEPQLDDEEQTSAGETNGDDVVEDPPLASEENQRVVQHQVPLERVDGVPQEVLDSPVLNPTETTEESTAEKTPTQPVD